MKKPVKQIYEWNTLTNVDSPPDIHFPVLNLGRHTPDPGGTLRPWDAADEYLLQHWINGTPGATDQPLLIVNDDFGALAVAAAAIGREIPITVVNDCAIARHAIGSNLALNKSLLPARDSLLTISDSLEDVLNRNRPGNAASGANVLYKLPKSHALLDHQLFALRSLVDNSTRFAAAGMTRHVHRSTIAAFERYLGSTVTSLARKKARLLFSKVTLPEVKSPAPTPSFTLPKSNLMLASHPALFSAGRLDAGTALLLESLPAAEGPDEIIDLGCGNGVIGIYLQHNNPGLHCHFIDSSAMAIKLSRQNHADTCPQAAATFHNADGLSVMPDRSSDRIFCNPPFHEKYHTGPALAHRFFKEARRVLRPQGELWVVANHHLQYPDRLKKLFGNCRTVKRDEKFSVYRVCH